ncbi:MAG: hypothetical protein AAGD35_17140 [Actinomycetota bacterium]
MRLVVVAVLALVLSACAADPDDDSTLPADPSPSGEQRADVDTATVGDEVADVAGEADAEVAQQPVDEAAFADAEAAFDQCMADQGFVGDTDSGYEAADPQALDAAFELCDRFFVDAGLDSAGSDADLTAED